MAGKISVIAPVGENMEALFVGIKEFPTEKVILISPPDKENKAQEIRLELEKFKIPVEIKKAPGNLWEDMFKIVADVKKTESENNIIFNVATGDNDSKCIATSAAFVNGIKAFDINPANEAILLPILKFSYYKLLTDKKMSILKLLSEPDCCSSFEEISKKTGMSLPLISYHINGTYKTDGLKSLGLISTQDKKGKIEVNLSTLGKLLVKGYISFDKEV